MPGTRTDCLPTGWEPIDREHAALAAQLTLLLSAVNVGDRARATAALAEFGRAAADHFAHEERLMAEAAYGQAARHKEAHDLYLADLREVSAELSTLGITPDFRRSVVGRVLEWFRFHVSANDVALGAFLLAHGRSGAAERPAAPVTRSAGARR